MYKRKNKFFNSKNVKINKTKRDNGITLIALVITIIVLIILAGISLNALVGENGILGRTTDARLTSKKSSLEEKIKMAIADRDVDRYSNSETQVLGKYLEKIENTKVSQILPDAWYVSDDEAIFTVYDNGDIIPGRVKVWDNGKIELPELKSKEDDEEAESENNVFDWYIYTPAQLKFLADFVNNGNSVTGDAGDLTEQVTSMGYNVEDIVLTENTTVYLMNNIDMGARQEGGVLTTGVNWTAIGKNKGKEFISKFDGNNYTIRGLYVNQNENVAGLFGRVNNEFKNLIVEDSYIEGYSGVGIISLSRNTIVNCHNINTTIISKDGEYFSSGGIVGQGLYVYDCSNSGNIFGNTQCRRNSRIYCSKWNYRKL